MDVLFEAEEPRSGVDVSVDIDVLTVDLWPDLGPLTLGPPAATRRQLVLQLPAGAELSYRFVRTDRTRPRPPTLEGLREHRDAGEPDPEVGERLVGAFGADNPASVLVLPGARRHEVWRGDGPAVPVAEITLADRTAVLVGEPHAERLVVLLDGDVWLGSLDLRRVWGAWSGAGRTSVLVVPTPDRELLPERDVVARLVGSALTGAAARGIPRSPRDVAVAGHSYSGLAAAALVVDRPDLASTALVGSGSFWFDDRALVRELQGADLSDRRFLLHVGGLEGEMIDLSRELDRAVRAAGARSSLSVWPGGHDYAWYRHAFFVELDRW